MRLSATLVALAFAIGTAFASGAPRDQPALATSEKAAVCKLLKDGGANAERLAQQGCCSAHGGVCGCQYGNVLCCDGQYSASCDC